MLESVFNKTTELMLSTVLKKRVQGKCFPVKFAKFLRTPFKQNISGCLAKNIKNSSSVF